jgi:hypothetical protein
MKEIFRRVLMVVTMLALIVGTLCIGMYVERIKHEAIYQPEPAIIIAEYNYDTNDWPVPSLLQLQRRLGIEDDGIYGEITRGAWDRQYSNQCAAKYFPKEKP